MPKEATSGQEKALRLSQQLQDSASSLEEDLHLGTSYGSLGVSGGGFFGVQAGSGLAWSILFLSVGILPSQEVVV